MAEDQRRVTRASGALGGGREDRREERFLEEVRREIRREVVEAIRGEAAAAAIRGEVAYAVERKLAEGWERMEHMLAQQAEEAKKQAEEARKQAAEDRQWRLEVVRRLEALEQAFRVGSLHGTEEDRGKAIERGTKRARVERREGLAQSQHAPQAEEESMHAQLAPQHRQKAPKPASTTRPPSRINQFKMAATTDCTDCWNMRTARRPKPVYLKQYYLVKLRKPVRASASPVQTG